MCLEDVISRRQAGAHRCRLTFRGRQCKGHTCKFSPGGQVYKEGEATPEGVEIEGTFILAYTGVKIVGKIRCGGRCFDLSERGVSVSIKLCLVRSF